MTQFIQDNLVFIIIAVVVATLVLWWLVNASRKTKVEIEERGDSETVARRNQALIDAPSAASSAVPRREAPTTERDEIEAVAPGHVSAAANFDSTAAATEQGDAEAGAPGSAREAIRQVPAELARKPAEPAAPTVSHEGDDLLRIKGVGPRIVPLLAEQGVTRLAQIAAWDDAAIDRIDAQMGRFQGRIRRDEWVDQARLLAADDLAGYEARFGKL
ncbi:hypothetical protein GRI62_09330 [Erythrobacter arachoides]|uniref:Uncharacterized protein n=1 Tax=Aurantiacibacter arachoides TaxID=1850444 RepID=A0A845A1L3_9SPHN|nr:hypothetical protein [Aurantiacibacter arachoides]MXO93808.1 hypothetical protein [Aurantiacibacter arachoides]GGD46526.1 hypothetical protein GCM10011411_02740 [Aurantiacibacter arachoides]